MAISSHNRKSKRSPKQMQYYTTKTTEAGSNPLMRFRTASTHDVLSGRGGSVNAHPGNIQFREWVSEFKTEYNLARNKDHKARLCRVVIDKVRALGGRFLSKDADGLWTELEEERVMAKTSQALREGAPKIRQAHRPVSSSSTSRRKRNLPRETGSRKQVRVDYKGHTVFPDEASPEVKPISSSFEPDILSLSLPQNKTPLRRSNSLVLPEIEVEDLDKWDFVDPFADESAILSNTSIQPSTPRLVPQVASKKIKRETSVSSTASDMGGLGLLLTKEACSEFPWQFYEWGGNPVSP